MAESRVQLMIGVDASGNASKVVKETRDQIDAMGQSAQRAQGTSLGFAQALQGGMTRLGAAFSGINAVLGSQTDPLIQKLGQGLTAAGAVANVIPGPIGVATAAVAGLATAAFAVKKEMDETDAKVRNLGDSSTPKLKDKLDITVDSAIALQRALDDTPKGLQATEVELAAVQARAKDTTKDSANASAELAKAFASGPKAVQDFQDKFGRLSSDVLRLPDLSKKFGLSKEAQGLVDNQETALGRLQSVSTELLLTDLARSRAAGALEATNKAIAEAHGIEKVQLESQAETLRQHTEEIQKQVDLLKEKQAKAQEERDKEKQAAKVAKDNADYVAGQDQGIALIKANIGREESKIPLELDKQSRKRQELIVWSAKQQLIQQQIALVQENIASGVKTEVQGRIELANLEAEANKLVSDQQAKQVKASSGPTKAQRLDAEKQAQLAVLQASQKQLEADVARNANKDDQLAAELKLNAVRQQTIRLEEEIAKRQAMAEATTAKGRAARLQAIELERANKQQEIIDATNKSLVDAITKSNQLEVDAKKTANTQLESLEKARSARRISELQARGKFDELAQAQQDAAASAYLAAIDRINADADAAVTKAEGNQVAIAEINRGRLAALAQSSETYADTISASFDKAFESTLKSVDDKTTKIGESINKAASGTKVDQLASSLVNVSGTLQKGAKSWKQYTEAAKLDNSEAMASAKLQLGSAIEGTIEASGAAAASFIKDEKDKAGVLALTETAAAAAAFATGNIAGGTSHAVAAGIYAGVWGGVIPSTSASSGGSTGGGSTTGGGEVAGTAGMAANSGGAVTQVFNFNKGFVFGTSQEVAKGMSSTLRNVSGTGYDKRKAV